MKGWKKQFAVIYTGQAFSIIGSAAVQFSIIWWLTRNTGSAITLTTAAIAGFLPTMFIGPFAGVWVDRYNRRTVMVAADGFVALSSAALAVVCLLVPQPPLLAVYFVLFLRGLGAVFHGPAMQAAIPMLVPADMLTKAGGWGNLINSLGNMIGPVIGAALMGMFSLPAIMLVDIVGAVFAIACLMRVNIPDIPQSAAKPQVLADLKEGFRAMRNNRPLLAVFFPMMLCNLAYMPLGSLFPLLVYAHYSGGEWHMGVSEFVFAGGLLVSSVVIGLWGSKKRRFLIVALAIGVLGAASTVSGLLPPTAFYGFVVCCFVMGSSGTWINVPMMAYTQESTPPELMGKVFSLIMTAMTLAMPIGLLVAGPVSEVIGIDKWFAYSGFVMMAAGVLCFGLTRRYDRAEYQALTEKER